MHIDRVKYKIRNKHHLRILMLNDVGFQYGAGIAHLRQIQSLLMLGHDVGGICWQQGSVEESIPFIPRSAKGRWLGMFHSPKLDGHQNINPEQIRKIILDHVARWAPDVVIVGNIHGSGWSLELLVDIQKLGCLVVAYMHDCYNITGRCAYPFGCELFFSGCNASCPTAQQYPQLPSEKIASAWRLRQEIFTQYPGIAIATNSQWTLDMACKALKKPFFSDVVRLGLDISLFRPLNRSVMRKVLHIPDDSFVIISGAVDVKDTRKGGNFFEQVIRRFSRDAIFLVFGRNPGLPSVRATGLIRDYRIMPLLYSAADIFIGTSFAEAFGQTYCEASACGLPIVAFNVGGIPEIARHDLNANLVNPGDYDQYCECINQLMENPTLRQEFGQAGRTLVEKEFSLEMQAARWDAFLYSFSQLM